MFARTPTGPGYWRAMSRGDVEIARGFIAAFNDRDIGSAVSYCHPSIEFHSTFAAVGGGVYRGHAGMRSWHQEIQEAWKGSIRAEPEAFFDLGSHILSFVMLHATGPQSGVEAALPIASISRSRDGLLVYFRSYIHREDALQDLGVSEDELVAISP